MASKLAKSAHSIIFPETPENTPVSITRKILRVRVFTPICKTLNGSLPSSKTAHFLRLTEVPYTYQVGKERKTASVATYFIKGLRGVVRHQAMIQCHQLGLEVCHSSDKEATKQGEKLLPEGFHLLGECHKKQQECIIHSIFGSMHHPSKIVVSADPIASITHKTYETDTQIQNVHIATETRIALSYEGKAIQDFGERYFSGEFTFELDVTQCQPAELGLLIESVMHLTQLGAGFNAGYAKIKIQELTLLQRRITRGLKWSDSEMFEVVEDIKETPLPKEVMQSLTAWKKYSS
jgi:hypothetical protein